jgi:2-isopropylmalate synthase
MAQNSRTGGRPSAEVVFFVGADQAEVRSEGNGPVDAVFKAIESQVGSGAELQLYSVNAITTGTESQGEVTVRLSRGGRIVNGVGADPDIVAASAKAYMSALNKLYSTAERLNPQTSTGP